MNKTTLPERIVFLARSESSVRTDAATLRSLGSNSLVYLTDSAKAVATLTELEKRRPALAQATLPDILICDEYVGNEHILSFLHALSQQMSLCATPMLVLTSTEATTNALMQCGIFALKRPYTQSSLEVALAQALETGNTHLSPAIFTFCQPKPTVQGTSSRPAKKTIVTTSDWCNKGLSSYQAGDLQQAESAFKTVLTRQADHIDANIGLACVYNKQDQPEKASRFLLKAAASAVRQGLQDKAASIFAKLPDQYRSGSIFLHEATAHLEEKEYSSAAMSFLDVARQDMHTPLHSIIARASQFTSEPEVAMMNLCNAYERMGQPATARALRQRLLFDSAAPTQGQSATWLDNYPRMREALQVASYTAQVWRHI